MRTLKQRQANLRPAGSFAVLRPWRRAFTLLLLVVFFLAGAMRHVRALDAVTGALFPPTTASCCCPDAQAAHPAPACPSGDNPRSCPLICCDLADEGVVGTPISRYSSEWQDGEVSAAPDFDTAWTPSPAQNRIEWHAPPHPPSVGPIHLRYCVLLC